MSPNLFTIKFFCSLGMFIFIIYWYIYLIIVYNEMPRLFNSSIVFEKLYSKSLVKNLYNMLCKNAGDGLPVNSYTLYVSIY